ncbi:DMT family transporter [Mycolicibacterium goodii]|uniref:DMT family transporter n=1 Tax=Mycolicibacterium goodii TaxID=134601 RepID=A0ABS6HJP0_MYCGD|nr:DMT family transporter [Mycolicibacterium goodii]MBU8822902.1 DMT family transporter [Mycolicibacterium goodii]MBU8839184.1 DMT family transporter [Mycolicibacterium goodii]
MLDQSSATRLSPPALSRAGLGWGFLGVTAFSFTVIFTRVALGGLSPLFIGAGRAVVAAALAAAALALTRQSLPQGVQWIRLVVVAAGVVAGFPLLTSYALTTVPATHGAVVVALLPAATAVAAVLRCRERPPLAFWTAAGLGAVGAVAFAMLHGGGMGQLGWPDLLLFGAVVAAAVGYAEGGLLARELGAWQTVSRALVVAAPMMAALTAAAVADRPPHAGAVEWAAFGYLAAVSMFLGFFAWYRGLAIGPIAQVSQVQLVQPVLTIGWAALLLHEDVTWVTVCGGAAVIACAAFAVRMRRSPTANAEPGT